VRAVVKAAEDPRPVLWAEVMGTLRLLKRGVGVLEGGCE